MMAPVQEGQGERALIVGHNESKALHAACDLPEPKLIQRDGTYPLAHYGSWANKNILVYGISAESGLDFSAQLNGDQTNKVLDMITDYIEQMPEVNKLEPFSKSVGSPCLALFSGDGLWYRARIVKELGEDVYEVKFVDYGDVERVKSESMIKCPPELCAYPEGVTEIAIYGFTGDEPAEEIENLRSLVEQKDLIGVIDSVEFEIKGRTRLLLSLYNLNWEPIRTCLKKASGIPLDEKSTDTESTKLPQCEVKDPIPTPLHVETIEQLMPQLSEPSMSTPLHPAPEISKHVSEMQQPEPEQPEVVISQAVPELEIPIVEDNNSILSAEVIVQVPPPVMALEPEPPNVTGTQIINSSPGTAPSSLGGNIFEVEQGHFDSSEKLLDPEPQTEMSSAENENADEGRESISLGSLATSAGTCTGVGVMEAEQSVFQSEQYLEHKSHHEVKPFFPGTSNFVVDVSAVPLVVVDSTSPVDGVHYKFQAGNSGEITDETLREVLSRATAASYNVNEDFTDGAMHVPSRSLPLSPKSPGLKVSELASHGEEMQMKLNSLLLEKESWALEKTLLLNQLEQQKSSAMSKIDKRDRDIRSLREEIQILRGCLVKQKEDGEKKVSFLESLKSHMQKLLEGAASAVAEKDALLAKLEGNLSTEKSETRRLAMIAAEKEKVISEKESGLSVYEDKFNRAHIEKNELMTKLKAAENEILSLGNKSRAQKSELERQIQDMQRQLDDGRQTPMFFGSARGDRTGGINLEAASDFSDEMVSISVALTSCLKSSKRNEQKYKTIINELELEIIRLQALIPSKID